MWGRPKMQLVPREKMWEAEKALSETERRSRYRCGDRFVTLDQIQSWSEYATELKHQHEARAEAAASQPAAAPRVDAEGRPLPPERATALRPVQPPPEPLPALYQPDEELNKIVSLWRGDITTLEIDGIVNAANQSLLGGGGIDGAIHRAAGDDLYFECKQLNGCNTGGCKISRGYRLPATYVLHTVGPIGEYPKKLVACYRKCLLVAVENGLRSIAFCGISTGIYGYPLEPASRVAIQVVREWLSEGDNRKHFDRIIFCVFLAKELDCYERLLPSYFPLPGTHFSGEAPPRLPEPDAEEADESSDDDEEEADEKNKKKEGEKTQNPAEAKAETKAETKAAEAKAETKPETEAETKPETEAETKRNRS
eukprot:TRINITY_DN1445_c0_g1_i10.p1 TRINITY_DN1445_c0_g1~~TRINITY_DN1445_c0_g1_i10.p1  ORF type:complete len:368 (-),score=84.11 TRINITY_DN1445_c0_g1_i10:573-1676(-)